MATVYTASASSGYMTDAMYDVMVGPFRGFVAHYSAPNAATGAVDPGFAKVVFIHVQDADPTTYKLSANAVGGQTVFFSGLVTGSTGYMLMLGF